MVPVIQLIDFNCECSFAIFFHKVFFDFFYDAVGTIKKKKFIIHWVCAELWLIELEARVSFVICLDVVVHDYGNPSFLIILASKFLRNSFVKRGARESLKMVSMLLDIKLFTHSWLD